jgi:dTDP-4-dehydrorhamnose 3,5-epimerase
MKFVPTKIEGVWIVTMDHRRDERGWFVRTWCAEEFRAHGLESGLSQCSSSFNLHRGTLRGMHFQTAPFEEAKIVRCTRGSAHDVALDLREGSPTFLQSVSVEISETNGVGLYIPKGCAHGFQTLEDKTEIFYSITEPYQPDAGRGVRWNDPMFSIVWPLADHAILSERDASYPDFASS